MHILLAALNSHSHSTILGHTKKKEKLEGAAPQCLSSELKNATGMCPRKTWESKTEDLISLSCMN